MYDEFTPPAGCSTAASSQCFINGLNDGAFPADGRRLADDFIAITTDPVTHVKFWARYNAQGYDYHAIDPTTLHGFCVKFYADRGNFECPNGSVPGETAIGDIVYDAYSSNFIEEEIFTGLIRNFNYCVTLPTPFYPVQDAMYWFSVSADFDFTSYADGVTQWFWRMYQGLGISFCEASWWDTWSGPGAEINWQPVSQAINLPCWAGWDASFVLYSGEIVQPTGACCVNGVCTDNVTQADCAGSWYQDQACDEIECVPVATESTTWGSIKSRFR
jgi:hypothetical protein